MAGVVGFEPTMRCTKNRCLTTWLHPNCGGVFTEHVRKAQDLKCSFIRKNFRKIFTNAQHFENREPRVTF